MSWCDTLHMWQRMAHSDCVHMRMCNVACARGLVSALGVHLRQHASHSIVLLVQDDNAKQHWAAWRDAMHAVERMAHVAHVPGSDAQTHVA